MLPPMRLTVIILMPFVHSVFNLLGNKCLKYKGFESHGDSDIEGLDPIGVVGLFPFSFVLKI